MKVNPNLVLKDYQEEAVRYGLKHSYFILSLDMGLGKSCTALEIARRKKGTILIVCPVYLVYNWEEEVKKWYDQFEVRVLRTKKDICDPFDFDIVIIPSTVLQKAAILFKHTSHVIVDEAHEFFNIESKRSQYLHKLVYHYKPKSLMLLSGTPIKNRTPEFYSLLVLCGYNPKEDNGDNVAKLYPYYEDFAEMFSFKKTFSVKTKRGFRINKVVYKGYKNLDILKKHLKGKFFRKNSKDCLDLKDVIIKEVVINNKKEDKLLKEFLKFVNSDDSSKINSKTKKESAIAKTKFTIKYIEGLIDEGIQSILVYSSHVDSCTAIAKHFNVGPITGAMDSSKRFELAEKFQQGGVNILVATIRSFNTGLNLTKGHNIVFNDKDWVETENEQGVARMHRIGQTKQVVVHEIYGSPQDKHISKLLKEKKEIQDKVVRGN